MTLFDCLADYLSVRTKIRSPKTHEHYRRSIRQFGEHLGREPTLGDLTDDNLSRFLLATVQSGFSPITANQRTKQIRALWNWCAKRRLVEHFPTFDDLDEPEPLPTAWSDEELHTLFSACAAQRGWIGPHQASTWWLAGAAGTKQDQIAARRDDLADLAGEVAQRLDHGTLGLGGRLERRQPGVFVPAPDLRD